jgi:hypothetical protein
MVGCERDARPARLTRAGAARVARTTDDGKAAEASREGAMA